MKTFPPSLSEAVKDVRPPTLFSCFAKASRNAQPTMRMSLDLLALMTKGASVLELHRTIIIGKIVVAGHHHQGTTETN